MGCLFLLQGIFLTQGSNLGLTSRFLPSEPPGKPFRESPVPGLSMSRTCQKKHLRLVSHYFFPLMFYVLDTPQFLQDCSAEGAVICCWGDPKEVGWRWESHDEETRSQPREFFTALSAQRLCHPLGAVSSVSLGGPAWTWRLWAYAGATGSPGPLGGAGPLAVMSSQLLQPQDTPAFDPRHAQTPGM